MRNAWPALVLLTALPAPAADLTCDGPGGGHLGAQTVCARVQPLLANHAGPVELQLTRDEPQVLAGRLVWSRNGARVTGPLVEVTAQDRPLDSRAADRLARGLIAVSDLP